MKELIFDSFHFEPNEALLETLENMDEQMRKLSGEFSPKTEDEQDALENYRADFLIRFVHHSSAIEGSTLTPMETALVLEGEFLPSDDKELKDLFAARGCAEGYDYMLRNLEERRTFDESFIKDIHERTALDCQPRTRGTYRTVPVYISGLNAAAVSPEKVREYMADLMFAFNNSTQHPVIKTAAFHAVFENIHPFRDGTGRTGRTILNYMLLKEGYPAIAIKSSDRRAYLRELECWQTKGEFGAFTELVARNVLKEAGSMIGTGAETRKCARVSK